MLRLSHALVLLTSLVASLAAGPAYAGQGAPAVTASVDLAGKHYDFTGAGDCRASQASSIYGTAAAQWHVMVHSTTSPLAHLNATIWLPAKGGAAMVTFSATSAGTSFDIATVTGGTVRGRATARVDRQGTAATLVIDGVTASGQAVKATIRCSRFSPPEDNG